MSATRLTDVVIPEIYLDYQTENNPEKTAFFESGVATRNPLLDNFASGGGRVVDVPFWKDLDPSTEPNLSSDDPDSSASPNKIEAGRQIARMAYLNQGYSTADLAGEIAGSNPMQRIRDRFGRYWMRQWQRRTIAVVNGIIADNADNDDGDMINDIASEDGDGAGSSELFSRDAFTEAAYTLGDMVDEITAIAVHSTVHKRMVDNDDIDFIPDSQGNLTIPTFMGRRVIVDDRMPSVAGGTSGFKYTSVLFGAGAIGYGEGTPAVPVEVDRDPRGGDGGGIEEIWERKSWLIHPFGFQFTGDSVSGESPSISELETASNWDRVIDRKNVPMAFLITNG